jgi:hypothetical protein
MEANDLGMLGLITATFAMPLLVLALDDHLKRRVSRRPVAKRGYAAKGARYQAHPIDVHRS